jgi:hypothetical protein
MRRRRRSKSKEDAWKRQFGLIWPPHASGGSYKFMFFPNFSAINYANAKECA